MNRIPLCSQNLA